MAELHAQAIYHEDGGAVLRASVTNGWRSYKLHHWVREGPVSETGDAALAAALIPAMRWGGTLRLDAPVSPLLLDASELIQRAFLMHSPRRFQPVRVVAPRLAATADEPGRGVACFFSAGVDSFYSVLSHREEITHLIYVHGFDVPLNEKRLRARVAAGLRSAAGELGLPLVEVESDVRNFANRLVRWDDEYFGACLASVALLLAPRFRKVYIASSFGPDDGVFCGSTPEVDPLWSTEAVQVVHDRQVNRLEKVATIARSPVALRWLRVCWENRGGAYNCGRCRKCVQAMVALRLAGALSECRSFPAPLRLHLVERLPLTSPYLDVFVQENLRAAEAAGDTELAEALRRAQRRATPAQRALDRLRERLRNGLRYRLAFLRR